MLTPLEIEKRSKEVIELFGSQLPKYSKCPWCDAEQSCVFIEGVGYEIPCTDCRNTKRYDDEIKAAKARKEKEAEWSKYGKKKVSAVWNTRKGKVYTDQFGNVLDGVDIWKTEKKEWERAELAKKGQETARKKDHKPKTIIT